MGKTQKPITIVVIGTVATWEEIDALEAQGHRVIRYSPEVQLQTDLAEDIRQILAEADVILGPKAWRMSEDCRKYLGVAIREARMLKYSSAAARASKKNRAEAEAEVGELCEPTPTD